MGDQKYGVEYGLIGLVLMYLGCLAQIIAGRTYEPTWGIAFIVWVNLGIVAVGAYMLFLYLYTYHRKRHPG